MNASRLPRKISRFPADMCGPLAMIDASVTALYGHGIALDAIHYDKFTDESTRAHRKLAVMERRR